MTSVDVQDSVSDCGQGSAIAEEAGAVHAALRTARRQQSIDIKVAADELCIRADYLRAIESGDLTQLPDHTFTIGFVRAYAEFLQLDACEVVRQYRATHGIELQPSSGLSDTVSATLFHNPADQGISGLGTAAIGLLGLLALLWIVGFGSEEEASASLISDSDDGYAARSDVQKAGVQMAAAQLSVRSSVAADTSAPERGMSKHISLRAVEDTWMKLRSPAGKSIWAGVLRKDETRVVDLADDVYLTTSNAGALMFSVSNSDEVRLGETGEPLVDMQLGSSHLISRADLTVIGSF